MRKFLLIGLLSALCMGGLFFLPEAQTEGLIVKRNVPSSLLQKGIDVEIYLPKSYVEDEKDYPVLYLLHGHIGNQTNWLDPQRGDLKHTLDSLIEEGLVKDMIVVMPNAGNSWYINAQEPMESAIIKELIPFIEYKYRVDTARTQRYIGGLSAGGYGSLRFILKYPHLFSKAILLSPAVYTPFPPANSGSRKESAFTNYGTTPFNDSLWAANNYPALWETFSSQHQPIHIYIATGKEDGLVQISDVEKLTQALSQKNIPISYQVLKGEHTWDVWKEAIKQGLLFL